MVFKNDTQQTLISAAVTVILQERLLYTIITQYSIQEVQARPKLYMLITDHYKQVSTHRNAEDPNRNQSGMVHQRKQNIYLNESVSCTNCTRVYISCE